LVEDCPKPREDNGKRSYREDLKYVVESVANCKGAINMHYKIGGNVGLGKNLEVGDDVTIRDGVLLRGKFS